MIGMELRLRNIKEWAVNPRSSPLRTQNVPSGEECLHLHALTNIRSRLNKNAICSYLFTIKYS